MGENHRFVPTTEPGVKSDISPRFTADRAVSVSGNYLVLPYVLYEDDGTTPMVLHNGDPVIYSAGGGTPIGGLVDGATYYFFTTNPADDVDLNHVQLVHTKCEATGDKDDCNTPSNIARGTPIDFTSTGSGRSQSLVPSGMLPAGPGSEVGPQAITTPARAGFGGVAVTASNSDYLGSIGIAAGGAGTAAVSLSGSIAVVTVHTTATIGSGAKINCADLDVACSSVDPAASGSQSVLVSAVNNFRTLGIAASIAIGGSAGVGASVAVRVVELHTDASIAANAIVNARNNIEILADAHTSVVSVNAAAGGGTVGVAGTVGVSIIKEFTNAFTGTGVTLRADNNIGVFAGSATQLILITASIAAGYVGVGVGVDVAIVEKTTKAYLGQSNTVIVKALGGGLTGVSNGTISGNGFPTTTFRGLAVQADSSEKLFGLVAGVGAGFVGVTANIGVNVFTVTTQAYVDISTTVNRNDNGTPLNLADDFIVGGVDNAQGVSVTATDRFESLTFAGGVAGGFVGAAGGIDIGVASITVNAYLATDTDVWAQGAVQVNALAIKSVQSYAVSIGGGFVGVAGAVSVWSIGTAPTASYSSDANGPHRGAWGSTVAYKTARRRDDRRGAHSQDVGREDNSTGVTPGTDSTKWVEDVPKTATSGEGTDGQHQADQVASGNGSDAPAPAWSGPCAYSKGDYVTYNGISTRPPTHRHELGRPRAQLALVRRQGRLEVGARRRACRHTPAFV